MDTPDITLFAWLDNNECAWCEKPVAREDALYRFSTGRVVHAGSCEESLDIQEYQILTVIFKGGKFTFDTRDDNGRR